MQVPYTLPQPREVFCVTPSQGADRDEESGLISFHRPRQTPGGDRGSKNVPPVVAFELVVLFPIASERANPGLQARLWSELCDLGKVSGPL